MRADRFGSYSIEKTLPGTSILSRRKSMRRYRRLCPPPRCHEVTHPKLLRPPDFLSGRSRDFSGFDRVISSESGTECKGRHGDFCLYCLMSMTNLLCSVEQLNMLPFG